MSTRRVLSMTGFGAGEAPLLDGLVHVELRAVNHRHLDVRVRAAAELADVSAVVEDVVRSSCVRGRIEAQARWDAPSAAAGGIDLERARRAYVQLLALRDELAPGEPVSFTALLALPGMLVSTQRFDAARAEAAVRLATQRAAEALSAMRAREGEALTRDMEQRIETLRGHAAWVEGQRGPVVEAARTKLQKRIEKLLEGTSVEVDPARLTQEVAWFADKSDIAEELTRLTSHFAQFTRALGEPGESVGKKLDFLVQEIGREINTIGSKANDAGIAHRVVEMKAELERIREQVQNVL